MYTALYTVQVHIIQCIEYTLYCTLNILLKSCFIKSKFNYNNIGGINIVVIYHQPSVYIYYIMMYLLHWTGIVYFPGLTQSLSQSDI